LLVGSDLCMIDLRHARREGGREGGRQGVWVGGRERVCVCAREGERKGAGRWSDREADTSHNMLIVIPA
jgi:hypothetical protein